MPSPHETDESDLSLIAKAIRRRIRVVLICFAVATLAAVGLTALAEKRYDGTTALLVRTSTAVEPQRAVDTNLQLLSLAVIAERTAARIPGLSKEDIEEKVSSSQQGESDIIEVTAEDSSAEQAARISSVFAQEFLSFRKADAQEGLETGRIQIVERASPSSSPVSPKPVRNVVFGALIGIVIGIGLALVLEQLDRRVKRREDLAQATGLTLLASIPKRQALDRNHLGKGSLSPAETEVFRLLRANLRYFRASHNVKSVLVASAEPGEGKTTVALGLALAAVTSGERVLLVEADLRDPRLSRLLGLPEGGGLSGALGSNAGFLMDSVSTVKAGDLAEAVGSRDLDVLHAGAIPPNPTELIESRRMRDLIAEAEQAYDFVVIDTPPVLAVSDAIPLMGTVGGVLVVSGLGVSTRSAAAELAELLERLGAPTLGLVANFAEAGGRDYEGYGYGRAPDPRLMGEVAEKAEERSSGGNAQGAEHASDRRQAMAERWGRRGVQ